MFSFLLKYNCIKNAKNNTLKHMQATMEWRYETLNLLHVGYVKGNYLNVVHGINSKKKTLSACRL